MIPELPPGLFEDLDEAAPGPARVSLIQQTLASSGRTIRPLPPDHRLTAFLVLAFVALAILGVLPIGAAGFHELSLLKKAAMYGLVAGAAWLLSSSLVEQMIPGARRRVPVLLAVAFPLLTLGLAAPLLFPEFSARHFVAQGIPCLRLGLICAVPSGVLSGIVLGRGYAVEPLRAAVAAGGWAGLVGVAVLALHCPIQNAVHVLAWHLGVIVIAAFGGGALGWIFTRTR